MAGIGKDCYSRENKRRIVMPSMNISVTPELLKIVKAKVKSGMYNNASEVVREAIRQMDLTAQMLKEMEVLYVRQALAEGVRQLDAGETVALTKKDILAGLEGEK
jgi:antitoxin ParD1/3/4